MHRVYHADLAQAQADPALAALFAAGPRTTPFDRLDWFRLLGEECLAPSPSFLAVAREGDAVAALPLCRDRLGLSAMANWYSFIARPYWTADGAPLLAAILGDLAREGALSFAPLPRSEAAIMLTAARKAGWIGWLSQTDSNHIVSTRGRDFATWWAQRPGALRETVRRKQRKGRVAIRISREFSATDLAADWAAYEAVYARSWKPEEGQPAFLRRFAMAEAAAGRLRIGLATIDGQPVAAQFWTVENGTAYIHKLAHDDRARAQSPGTLLSHALFAMAFDEDRVAMVDFGTGDDPYKRDWTEDVRPRYRLEAFHPRALAHWPRLARLCARRLLRPRDFAALPSPDLFGTDRPHKAIGR
ncbi:hypothetical protein Y88_1020 [Novosphingobium nitrogenifigens DSM 19370]|uniref:BioF2-like acetyltransferase domain-containing protein n=1 Tax=Novosphingobium nitrogenifigens DSM 19370 TaxID=983920 RepID=F1Z922_9SPHN|nr:GNAT family N-acetyltransferase [Novosphingobium nitrogenifigens]EGD58958.1 hypothetical protein Y88_1020 [Novosphingobium nitrogenifigens DSM 19370]